MLVRRLGVRRGARAKHFPTFRSTLPPFLTGSAWQRAAPESPNFAPRSSAFRCACAAYSSRARVSCFSFFAFTSSPVCDKRLWDSSFGVKAFVNVLHEALSSPLIDKQSVNCEVKVKTKIENSLCARYAQARVCECSRKSKPHDRLRRKSQWGYHLDEGGVDKMRGGFARKSPIFYLFFRGFEKYEKNLLENLDCSR